MKKLLAEQMFEKSNQVEYTSEAASYPTKKKVNQFLSGVNDRKHSRRTAL
jgi:hypothetical protein